MANGQGAGGIHPRVVTEEGQWLQRTTRTSKNPVRPRRATIVMASTRGLSVPDIAAMFATTEGYVRRVVHDFNERGFAALNPKVSSRRPKRIDETTREQISPDGDRPQSLGLPFTCWSLTKLVEHLVAEKVVEAISTETVRQILKDGGVTWQATTTRRGSTDPDFKAKKARVLDLVRPVSCPTPGCPKPRLSRAPRSSASNTAACG